MLSEGLSLDKLGTNLEAEEEQGSVPCSDTRADSHGLVADQFVLSIAIFRLHLSGQFVAPSSIIADCFAQISTEFGSQSRWLPHRYALKLPQSKVILIEQIREFKHALLALATGHLAPCSFKRGLCCNDRIIDVLFTRAVDLVGDDRVIGRVSDGPELTGFSRDIL